MSKAARRTTRPPKNVTLAGTSPEASERIRRAFLSMALCHEMKQPLHSLSLNVELLGKRAPKAVDDPTQLAGPLNALGRVVERINDCLDAFALRIQPDPIDPTPVDVRPVLESAALRAAPAAKKAGVKLLVDVPADIPGVPLHPDQLGVALDALLENAILASPKGATVAVTVHPTDEELRIEITDSGTGMSPEVARRAPEIGFSTRNADGTGLTIAKFIAYHHTGGFQVTSVVGQGTTIAITLPLQHEE